MAESSPSLAHSPTQVQGTGDGGTGEDEPLEAGAQVGEYVVERFLGAGAMGEVYAGIQPVIGKKVAIKVLKRHVAASPDGAERFKREARAVNQIAHPNVIDVFSFGRLDDGRLYLVMDLVEGTSLRKAITAGPLDVPTALDVLGQIADALDAAHAKGVVHRDLKPDNVMLGSGDPPKVFVLDFGLAKLLAADGAAAQASMLTGQGTWLGTPGYMAPEQWSADGAVPASDRYSLGVMAFELLAGALPFEAKSLPQMMEQHFRAKVPALSARGAVAASSAFDPVLARAMAKDPDARFPSGREMVEALRAAAGAKGRRPSATPAKRPWVPAVVGVGVLGLSVAAVLSLRGTDRDDTSRSDRPGVTPPTEEAADGMLRIPIDSVPRGATVKRGNVTATETTPTFLEAREGERVAFELSRPGYATSKHELVAAKDLRTSPYVLVAIDGFEGVWLLPNGGLRAFARDGDSVTGSKLTSVDGPREYFRTYKLVPAETGATFVSKENIHEPGRPEHPSCYFEYTTEYHYEPATDALTVRREHIVSDELNGTCMRKSSTMTEPERLARADRHSSTERESLAPVGKPILDKKNVKRPPSKDGKTSALDAPAQLQRESNVGNPPGELKNLPPPQQATRGEDRPPPKPPAKDEIQQQVEPQQATVAKPQAPPPPPPQKAAPPPIKGKGGKAQLQQQVRGDAQVAPPVAN